VDDEFFDLLASTVSALGLELVDAEIRTGMVRVVVDRDGGADVDAISEATKAVSSVLDDHDPQSGRRYTLEVSSPGLERPLRAPQHFTRAIGEIVTLRTASGGEGERRVKGRLVSADGSGFVLEGDELGESGRRFSYDEIERARTVFEWPAAGSSSANAAGHGTSPRRAARQGRAKDTKSLRTR